MQNIKLTFYLFTALFLFLVISCEHQKVPESTLEMRDTLIYKKGETEPYTGHEKARIQDKIIEYDVVNGIKQGDFKLYFPDGTIQIEGKIKDNKNIGEWKYYYESGDLESKGEFENDKPKGEWTWYYPSGKIKEKGNYFEGNRIGTWQQYDESGEVIDEKDFSLQDSGNNDKKYIEKLSDVHKDK